MTSPRRTAKPRRSRRRVPSSVRRPEARVLTALIGLRMSDEDRVAIEWKAKQLGYPSAQHWIRECIKPGVEQAKREKRVDGGAAQEVIVAESASCQGKGQ